jgi:hypothetical protein
MENYLVALHKAARLWENRDKQLIERLSPPPPPPPTMLRKKITRDCNQREKKV